MKRAILGTFALIVFCMIANAQVRIGPKIGGNLSNFVGDNEQFYTENSHYKFGFNGGFAVNFEIIKLLSIQTAITYSQKGAFMNEEEDFQVRNTGVNLAEDWDMRTEMHYLKLPLIAKLAFGGENFRFYLTGGGYGSYLLGKEYAGPNGDDFANVTQPVYPSLDEQYKDVDYGYTGGFGFQFTVNEVDHFLIDFRFSRSLQTITNDIQPTPLSSTQEYDQFNQVFTLSFGYLINTGSSY